jgi:hypothetical protein
VSILSWLSPEGNCVEPGFPYVSPRKAAVPAAFWGRACKMPTLHSLPVVAVGAGSRSYGGGGRGSFSQLTRELRRRCLLQRCCEKESAVPATQLVPPTATTLPVSRERITNTSGKPCKKGTPDPRILQTLHTLPSHIPGFALRNRSVSAGSAFSESWRSLCKQRLEISEPRREQ